MTGWGSGAGGEGDGLLVWLVWLGWPVVLVLVMILWLTRLHGPSMLFLSLDDVPPYGRRHLHHLHLLLFILLSPTAGSWPRLRDILPFSPRLLLGVLARLPFVAARIHDRQTSAPPLFDHIDHFSKPTWRLRCSECVDPSQLQFWRLGAFSVVVDDLAVEHVDRSWPFAPGSGAVDVA